MISIQAQRSTVNVAFEALSEHARFYPVNPDKSPAIRNLSTEPTADRLKIKHWQSQHLGFAARIETYSRLFVLDMESPHKHVGAIGPDGLMGLSWRLDEHNLTLPPAPTVRSATGGYHFYMLAPEPGMIHHRTALWPGVDVLAAGSNVILPGSSIHSGVYEVLRGFEECDIPEAPESFVRLLRDAGAAQSAKWRELNDVIADMPTGGESFVPKRAWYRLWRNKAFVTMWNRRKIFGDRSDSAYEFQLASSCFCCGLSNHQVLTVLRCWWRTYGMRNRERKFRRAIMPSAWKSAEPWVTKWRERQTCLKSVLLLSRGVLQTGERHVGRPQSPTVKRILMCAASNPAWTIRQIADACDATYNHALKTLKRYRMEDSG